MTNTKTIQAAVTAQSTRVEKEVISCLRIGTLSLDVAEIKEFIESDFLSENDLVDQFGEEAAEIRADACGDLIEKFRSMIECPLEHSTKVDDAFSIERVAEIINTEESSLPVDQVAGYYAFQAALENAKINGIEFIGALDDLEPHLEILQDAGANFDWANAIRLAEIYTEQHHSADEEYKPSLDGLTVDDATRTNAVFAGCWSDSWTTEEDGEEVVKYLDQWSAIGTDKDGKEYKIVWLFENYKDGRIEDDCLNWDKPHSIEEI